ncbi:cytochrome P450 [Calocera viscosa TUFC12733]|uniref:Cytochrome P450 n=1 Tax=Calocera viscosa (strain TUFC12733) TaxID=1330018 RepID=A0A167H6Q3_CALVF|nr:cytochrome P450 [Calocera viscosa TUFC12733]
MDSITSHLEPHRLLGVALSILIVYRIHMVLQRGNSFAGLPIRVFPFAPYRPPGVLLPCFRFNPGIEYPWKFRKDLYQGKTGTFAALALFFCNDVFLFTRDLRVIRQATGPGRVWGKDESFALAENFPSSAANVATAEDEEHTRHRRIMSPAFNDELYRDVWAQGVKKFGELSNFASWTTSTCVTIEDFQNFTSKFTLSIMAKAGFDIDLPWEALAETKKDDAVANIWEVFEIVGANVITACVLPSWAEYLPVKLLKNIFRCRRKLREILGDAITKRQTSSRLLAQTGKRDILTHILQANGSNTYGTKLNDDEVMSNTFVMFLTGHETSATALAVIIGWLALHQKLQETLYTAINSVLIDGRPPTFDDYGSLKPVLDCIMESLRLLPIAPIILREAKENTILTIPERTKPLVVPKGTMLVGDLTGLNYDPDKYPDPERFDPSRWSSKSELTMEDYIAFGLGIHACLGRKFALHEMVCFLTLLVRGWQIQPILKDGETDEGWRKRVMEDNMHVGISTGPRVVPVTLIRR